QQRDAVLRVLLVPDRVCGWADGLCRRAGMGLVRDHSGADRAGLPVVEPLGLLRGRAITLPGTARPASRFSKHVRTSAARGGGYLLCLLGSALMLLPFIWMVRSSVMELAQIFAFPPQWIPHPLRLNNYREAFAAVPSLRYLLNTLSILIPVVLGTVVTSACAAFGFARLRWTGRDWIFALLMTTLILPSVITLIPTYLVW